MTRSQLIPLPQYFDRYIDKVPDVTLFEALDLSIAELENAPVDKWRALGDQVYAPGKWTVKDMLQHMIDTERVFSYRATAFARGEKKALPFDEDQYALHADANRRTLEDLLDEAILLRRSFISQYRSFSDEMLHRVGIGFTGECSVEAIGFIVPGHQRWHFDVLEERYYPML